MSLYHWYEHRPIRRPRVHGPGYDEDALDNIEEDVNKNALKTNKAYIDLT